MVGVGDEAEEEVAVDEARQRKKNPPSRHPDHVAFNLGHHSRAHNQSANMLISLNFLLFSGHNLIANCPLQIKEYIACLAVKNRPRCKRENAKTAPKSPP